MTFGMGKWKKGKAIRAKGKEGKEAPEKLTGRLVHAEESGEWG